MRATLIWVGVFAIVFEAAAAIAFGIYGLEFMSGFLAACAVWVANSTWEICQRADEEVE